MQKLPGQKTLGVPGTCEKKRSLGESCVDHDNNHCVTRLCDDSNTCSQRTSGCASFSDCIGAAVDSGKDFFQTEISGEVEVYTDYWGSEYQVEELTQVCNFPSGGPNCPSQPCHGYGRLRHGEGRRRLTDIDLVIKYNTYPFYEVLRLAHHHSAKLIYSGSSTKFSHNLDLHESPYSFSKRINTELLVKYAKWFNLKFEII